MLGVEFGLCLIDECLEITKVAILGRSWKGSEGHCTISNSIHEFVGRGECKIGGVSMFELNSITEPLGQGALDVAIVNSAVIWRGI